MKNIILIGLFFFLMGCSVSVPALTEYRIDPMIKKNKVTSNLCKDKTITIGQVFTSNSLMTNQMRYGLSGYKEYSYTESEWANAPSKSISIALLKSVRDAEIFKSVNSYRSRARNDLLLETHVDSFMQYYTGDNNSSYVKVVFSFALVRVKDVKALDSIVIEKELSVDTLNAEGGVKALNFALSEVLVETNLWLSEACK